MTKIFEKSVDAGAQSAHIVFQTLVTRRSCGTRVRTEVLEVLIISWDETTHSAEPRPNSRISGSWAEL